MFRIAIDRLLTIYWTFFYTLFGGLYFDRKGKGCVFESRIYFPQFGGRINLGNGVRICRSVEISVTKGGQLEIESGVLIGAGSLISCHGKIKIGKGSMLAEYCLLHDNNHKFSLRGVPIADQGFNVGSISIGSNCWIGSRVTILMDAFMEDNVIVAASSTVRKGVLRSNSLYAGTPAVFKKEI